jgi:hypothetical protein
MRNLRAILLCAALMPFAAGTAWAQVTTPDPAIPPAQPAPVFMPDEPLRSGFIASGLIGSTFGDAVDDANLNVTGTVGYLWTQRIGAEFMAAFTPNASLPGLTDTAVNSYMANVMFALPLGFEGQWQPYLSGGLGAMTLGSTQDAQFDIASENSFAGNIGFGLMGYANDNIGFRVDVRRISQLGDAADDAPVLNDLAVWRANAGVAFRW